MLLRGGNYLGQIQYTPSTASYRTIVYVLDYSYTRTSSGVSITYSFYAFRENAWSGTATQGSIDWNVQVNGTKIKSGSNSNILIPNDHSKVYFCSNETYNLSHSDQYTGGSFTITMRSTSANNTNLVCNAGTDTVNFNAYADRGAPGNPAISITDNGNNTFTLNISKGSDGAGNPATGYVAQYNTGPGWANCSNGHNQSVSSDTNVQLKAYTTGTYSNSSEVSTSKTVYYYGNPSAPGKPTLSCKRPGRPTLKETLTFNWSAATAATHTSIQGYRIRFVKNGSFITGTDPNDSSKEAYDRETTSTSYTIPQAIMNQLAVKDTFKLGIYAYAKDAAGNKLFNGRGSGESQVFSDEYTVCNNSVVRININGEYKEGTVYVKSNDGSWSESQGVYLNSGSGWKESQ